MPATPTPPTRPPNVSSTDTESATPNRATPLSPQRILAWGELMIELIIAQVAMALGNIDILGVHPLAFLTQWGKDLEQKASDAFIKAETAQDAADAAQGTADDAHVKATTLAGMLDGILPGSGTVVAFIEGLIGDIPGIGPIIVAILDGLGAALDGGIDGVTTALRNIPGLNIVSTLLSSVIPGLDASKVTSGSFPLGMISGLIDGGGKIVTGLLSIPATIVTGLLSAGGTILSSLIPGLDASKIVSGSLPQSAVTGLPTALSDADAKTTAALNGLAGTVGVTFTPDAAASTGSAVGAAARSAVAASSAAAASSAVTQATTNIGASAHGTVRSFFFGA